MSPSNLTEAERERILTGALLSRTPLCLKVLPSKVSKKAVVLEAVAELFQPGREYTQPEVNTLLSQVYSDPVTLRRDLIDFHFLSRTKDGATYWREATANL